MQSIYAMLCSAESIALHVGFSKIQLQCQNHQLWIGVKDFFFRHQGYDFSILTSIISISQQILSNIQQATVAESDDSANSQTVLSH